MFNARYLEIADVAMSEYFRALGWAYDDLVRGGTDPSVVSARLAFERPAHFDDLLDIDAACTRVGTRSFDLQITATRGDEVIATIDLVYVNVDALSASSRPLPESVTAAMHAEVQPDRAADKSQ